MFSFIGIDPGATGAICAVVPELSIVEFLPTTMKAKDLLGSLAALNSAYPVRMIMIEDVHSMANMAAKANFSFGRNVERVNLIAELTGFSIDLVQPKAWQKIAGVKPLVKKKGALPIKAAVKSKYLKNAVATVAKRLYPDAEIHGPKGGLLDGRSDALMICHYNYLKYK